MVVKAVLFDLWNTLIFNDSHKKKRDEVLEIIGIERRKEFRKLLLNWWFTNNVSEEEFFEKVCDELEIDKNKVEELTRIWKEQYEHARLFRNTLEVLEELKEKGIKLGLVTNTASYAKRIVEDLGLSKYFDVMVFSFEAGVTKPDEKIYEIALEKLKMKPEECLFIGDEILCDVAGPRKVGMKSFLINRKYHSENNIQSLKGVFDLIDWIE